MRLEVPNPEEVVKEAFWLAWQACGGPFGLGLLQDCPGATREDVWANVFTGARGGDYPSMKGVTVANPNRPGRVYGDYVFGRMIKLFLRWDEKAVEWEDLPVSPDYQAWCVSYPTTQALVEAAARNVAAV